MEAIDKMNFDDIRPVHDTEVRAVIEKLLADSSFRYAVEPMIKPLSWEMFSNVMLSCKSIFEFQYKIIFPFMKQLIAKTTSQLTAVGFEQFSQNGSSLIITNHRDIVLDAAFLNILFVDYNLDTCEIAIGDNLLIYPWITDLVRLNKSFIVKRKVAVREMLAASKHLSEYIYDTINNRNQSIWIAQREGRAKNSDDKTQTSLLKMLTLYESAKPVEALQQLNILPLSISYEYDPCDYLKAKEFQQKRDNPQHKKSPGDDIENMRVGITGYKGRVFFKMGNQINQELAKIENPANRSEVLELAAKAIDTEIHKNYVFFPINYIAYDMMENSTLFADKYNEEDKDGFIKYLEGQVDKVDLPNKDNHFLRQRIVEMYGNTVKNQLAALSIT